MRALLLVGLLALGCSGSTESVATPGGSGGLGGSGGQGGATSDTNTIPVVVDTGPDGPQSPYVNGLFASATVCVPGSDTTCQTIDGLLVDTSSSGLRLLSSVLTLALPKQVDAGGDSLADCAQFADATYLWGEVALADVRMGGERARSVPVQIVAAPGSTAFPAPPTACASGGGQNAGTVADLGANGILGISFFRQDCGDVCTQDTSAGVYYRCAPSGCTPSTAALGQQVVNPVWMFGADNNGTIISLPPIAAGGAARAAGTLTFGIGTQANNTLGGAPVLVPDATGSLTTVFNGRSYGSSAIDSGSNAVFFLSSSKSGLPICQQNTQFYCPPTTQSISASLAGVTGASAAVSFDVANADSLFAVADLNAFADLAGPNAPVDGFLWGLSFFFNRKVATAIEGQTTPSGTGPYWALP
jgi:hypothetical protein